MLVQSTETSNYSTRMNSVTLPWGDYFFADIYVRYFCKLAQNRKILYLL